MENNNSSLLKFNTNCSLKVNLTEAGILKYVRYHNERETLITEHTCFNELKNKKNVNGYQDMEFDKFLAVFGGLGDSLHKYIYGTILFESDTLSEFKGYK